MIRLFILRVMICIHTHSCHFYSGFYILITHNDQEWQSTRTIKYQSENKIRYIDYHLPLWHINKNRCTEITNFCITLMISDLLIILNLCITLTRLDALSITKLWAISTKSDELIIINLCATLIRSSALNCTALLLLLEN